MEASRRAELEHLSQTLGYQFQNLDLLDRALRHSSYVHEHPEVATSNERLEYLGDAVLELVITEFLYTRFPDAAEGQLSKARSGVVNEHRLAATARRLELGTYLLLGRGEAIQKGHEKPSILADALEAVAASVYLDGGLEPARQVLETLLSQVANDAIQKAYRKDYKTRLQEVVQEAMHITPRYYLAGSEGPDHDKRFEVTLEIDGKPVATGRGRSKKEAEQDAARQALEATAASADAGRAPQMGN